MQPLRRYALDAAILFSDILVVPDALGAEVCFVEGEGPKITPIRDRDALRGLSPHRLHAHLAPVYETLGRLRAALDPERTLIGFSGAPWTLAAYLIEGGGSKEFLAARTLARRDPMMMTELVELLTESVSEYLAAQIRHGAEVVQLFDSWAGVLPPDEFERWCVAPHRQIVRALRNSHPEVPIITFPRGIGAAYPYFASEVPSDGLSLDTTVDPQWARDALRAVPCLQGNLDPVALLAGGSGLGSCVEAIRQAWSDRPYIFNLGHGVLPQTPPEHVNTLLHDLKRTPGSP